MGTQLVLSFAKRLFFNLSNALNPKPNSQTIRILSPYRNISLFSLVFILKRGNDMGPSVIFLGVMAIICIIGITVEYIKMKKEETNAE